MTTGKIYFSRYIFILLASLAYMPAFAQEQTQNQEHELDKYIQSDVIPMIDKKGFSFQTKAGDFMFKPYTLVQSAVKLNYYDDEGLELSDQDNIANSGFEIPYAILGLSGRFNKLTFNFTLNAAK